MRLLRFLQKLAMTNNYMISIIIPVYNQAKHLNKCLASIFNQIYENYEIIVVNDGSTDKIDEVMGNHKKLLGIKLIYLEQKNQGANAARNAGSWHAAGEFLLFCDADTLMKPKMLANMRETLKNNPNASFCYSSFAWGSKIFKLWPYELQRLKRMPYINIASLIRKQDFPGFDERLKRFQDWDLWLTMAERGCCGIWLDQVLYQINTSGSQTMSNWLPSYAYKLFPFLPSVKKYNQAKEIIFKKHHLI